MNTSVDFPDFYKILGVESNASLAVIKQRYHQLSLQHHPDKSDSPGDEGHEVFTKINTAYKVLSQPDSKEEYDLQYVAHANRSVAVHDQVPLSDLDYDTTSFKMQCRCGGMFEVTKEAAELPVPSVCVSCDTCSLCISVTLT